MIMFMKVKEIVKGGKNIGQLNTSGEDSQESSLVAFIIVYLHFCHVMMLSTIVLMLILLLVGNLTMVI